MFPYVVSWPRTPLTMLFDTSVAGMCSALFCGIKHGEFEGIQLSSNDFYNSSICGTSVQSFFFVLFHACPLRSLLKGVIYTAAHQLNNTVCQRVGYMYIFCQFYTYMFFHSRRTVLGDCMLKKVYFSEKKQHFVESIARLAVQRIISKCLRCSSAD